MGQNDELVYALLDQPCRGHGEGPDATQGYTVNKGNCYQCANAVIDKALAAERERCAKVIEKYAGELEDGDENLGRNILLFGAVKIREA